MAVGDSGGENQRRKSKKHYGVRNASEARDRPLAQNDAAPYREEGNCRHDQARRHSAFERRDDHLAEASVSQDGRVGSNKIDDESADLDIARYQAKKYRNEADQSRPEKLQANANGLQKMTLAAEQFYERGEAEQEGDDESGEMAERRTPIASANSQRAPASEPSSILSS